MNLPLITFQVQEIEPGWTCVTFSKPPQNSRSRTHALITFIETWRQQNPDKRIEDIEFVEHQQLVRGLNIFWSPFGNKHQAIPINEFRVDQDIRDMYGAEYVEALTEDALCMCSDHPSISNGAVIISKREVVILILPASKRAVVTTLKRFLEKLDSQTAAGISAGFDDWQKQEAQGYFFTVLPVGFNV